MYMRASGGLMHDLLRGCFLPHREPPELGRDELTQVANVFRRDLSTWLDGLCRKDYVAVRHFRNDKNVASQDHSLGPIHNVSVWSLAGEPAERTGIENDAISQ